MRMRAVFHSYYVVATFATDSITNGKSMFVLENNSMIQLWDGEEMFYVLGLVNDAAVETGVGTNL